MKYTKKKKDKFYIKYYRKITYHLRERNPHHYLNWKI